MKRHNSSNEWKLVQPSGSSLVYTYQGINTVLFKYIDFIFVFQSHKSGVKYVCLIITCMLANTLLPMLNIKDKTVNQKDGFNWFQRFSWELCTMQIFIHCSPKQPACKTLRQTGQGQFGHLAIAVSPRLEVEIGGHASLDGCNFQRKRPGPHGVSPAPPCVHRLPCG